MGLINLVYLYRGEITLLLSTMDIPSTILFFSDGIETVISIREGYGSFGLGWNNQPYWNRSYFTSVTSDFAHLVPIKSRIFLCKTTLHPCRSENVGRGECLLIAGEHVWLSFPFHYFLTDLEGFAKDSYKSLLITPAGDGGKRVGLKKKQKI